MNQSKKKVLAVLMVASMAIPTGMSPVSDAAKKVKFNKTNITVKVGKKAKVTLKNAAKKAKVTWKISNKKVIKLTKKSKKYAVVKGVKKGTTTLKATYKKGKVKKILKCKVKVEKDAAKTTASVAPGTSAPTQPATPATPATSATPTQSAAAPTQSAAASTEMPTTVPTTAPSLIKVAPKVDSKEAYSYFNDYTLGYDTKEEKVVAYKMVRRCPWKRQVPKYMTILVTMYLNSRPLPIIGTRRRSN